MSRIGKSLLAFLYIISALLLGGCGLRDQAREAEELLVVQTLGCDTRRGGVRVSLASAAGGGADGSPARLTGEGPSITAAIERIRAGADEETLFCAHLGHLLVGEQTAREGLALCLDYVCRSGELRLSVPLYVLRGAEAREAVLSVGDESFGVCDALDSVDADLRGRSDGRCFTAAEILRDLERQGGALVCAVRLQSSAERPAAAEAAPQTLLADGYAVLREGRLCGFLDREEAAAVGLIEGLSGLCEVTVSDQAGLPATLTLTGGSCALEPDFDEQGRLASLGFAVEAEAQLSELAAEDTEPDYLRRMLERALAERVRGVLRLSQRLDCDFLGLGARLERQEPRAMHAQERPFAALWPELPLRVSVTARLAGAGGLEIEP